MTRQQLFENIKKKASYLCVGLDADIKKIPQHLLKFDDPVFEFNHSRIINDLKDTSLGLPDQSRLVRPFIRFFNENEGVMYMDWAQYGGYGRMYTTVDGGKTWLKGWSVKPLFRMNFTILRN